MHMFYLLSILNALSDPSQLLNVTRGHTELLNSVVRIKIDSKL